jgi:hypothetical protein
MRRKWFTFQMHVQKLGSKNVIQLTYFGWKIPVVVLLHMEVSQVKKSCFRHFILLRRQLEPHAVQSASCHWLEGWNWLAVKPATITKRWWKSLNNSEKQSGLGSGRSMRRKWDQSTAKKGVSLGVYAPRAVTYTKNSWYFKTIPFGPHSLVWSGCVQLIQM